MGFDTDVDLDEEYIAEDNPYIASPDKGLELVASLTGTGESTGASNINHVIDALVASCGRIGMEDEISRTAELKRLVERLKTPARNRILNGMVLIGVGGQFSAGKSAVLNSLLGDNSDFKLPERQEPSTSVSTYIMQTGKNAVKACTIAGNEVDLEPDALDAISHQFREKRKLNLAQYIDFIAVGVPDLPVPGIALLDTPGYNAADVNTMQDFTDRNRSSMALKSVDRLVWLMSALVPTLEKTDIDFIKALNQDGRILVVVNKCDLKDEIYHADDPGNNTIISQIRNDFANHGLVCDDIIPYSARFPDWHNGRERILNFLEEASRSGQKVADLGHRLREITNEIRSDFLGSQQELLQKLEELGKGIDLAANPLEIPSIVQLRGLLGLELTNLKNDNSIFDMYSSKLLDWASARS